MLDKPYGAILSVKFQLFMRILQNCFDVKGGRGVSK